LNAGGGANSKADPNANSQTKVGLKGVDTSCVDHNRVAAQDFGGVAAEDLRSYVNSVATSDCSTSCASDEEFGLFVGKNLKVGH
jgi:hypothetical protein